jgi:hypothetical protein
MLDGFFNRKKDVVLLIDIGTETVSVALLYMKSGKPYICYTYSESFDVPLTHSVHRDPSSLTKRVTNMLRMVTTHAHKHAYTVTSSFISLSYFWSSHLAQTNSAIHGSLTHMVMDACGLTKSNIHMVSFADICKKIIAEHFIFDTHYIFLDITGETTDIAIIENNDLVLMDSFPSGKHFLLRHVAEAFGVSTTVARSFLSLHGKDKLQSIDQNKLDTVVQNIGESWYLQLENSILGIRNINIPHTLVYIADEDVIQYYGSFIQHTRHAVSDLRLADTVLPVTTDTLATVCLHDPRVRVDSFLCLIAGYAGYFKNK